MLSIQWAHLNNLIIHPLPRPSHLLLTKLHLFETDYYQKYITRLRPSLFRYFFATTTHLNMYFYPKKKLILSVQRIGWTGAGVNANSLQSKCDAQTLSSTGCCSKAGNICPRNECEWPITMCKYQMWQLTIHSPLPSDLVTFYSI